MPPFSHHIFICTNQRPDGHSRGCCDCDGTAKLREAFKDEVKNRNLGPCVRANSAGCLDQCELGPVVVIYPQQIWYGSVKLDDVTRIIDETIVNGRVIEELRIPDHLLKTKGGRLLPPDVNADGSGTPNPS
ncbi:MAG: (2Fe-2S) ferredoxin domain-containing protein [Planctomycetales bacterium]|nr:(2Fe-2S) ferredoxin domain-containing protein [Planctomycetales bacterium]